MTSLNLNLGFVCMQHLSTGFVYYFIISFISWHKLAGGRVQKPWLLHADQLWLHNLQSACVCMHVYGKYAPIWIWLYVNFDIQNVLNWKSHTHHGYRSSRLSPLCVVVQQDRWAAGTAAWSAGGAAGDGLWWTVTGALYCFIQAVHRPLLTTCGHTTSC